MVSILHKFVFFAVAVLHCVLGAVSFHCARDEFKCEDEDRCIPWSYRCDGVRDCEPASDEYRSICGESHCPDGFHSCDNKCWIDFIVCDGDAHCEDGSDEKHCGNVSTCKVNEFLCSDGSRCIPMRMRCDGTTTCPDFSEEHYCQDKCPEGQLSCDSGQCVRELLFCDGIEHCGDGSDERDCGHEDSDVFFLNEGPYIYVTKRTKAGLAFTHPLPVALRMNRTGVHSGGLKITGLGFDVSSQNLFISDAGGAAIIAVNVTSLDWRYLVNDSIASPMDVAFDWSSNNLYWIDAGSGTAEVVSVDALRRTVIIRSLSNPVSLALSPKSGTLFIATSGFESYVFMYGMDGRNRRILDSVQGAPASLALHPTKSILYWTDPGRGTISYANYSSTGPAKILKKNIDRVMSVTVTEQNFYFTSGEPVTSERAHQGKNPGFEKYEGWKSITSAVKPSGKSSCLFENGGCDYLCLTSELGRSCACSSEKTLGDDGKSCLD